ERPVVGQLANEEREAIQTELANKKASLEQIELDKQLAEETIDVTLPGRKINIGSPHILTSVIEEIEDLFIGLGYEIKEKTEVETDCFNVEVFNITMVHPASKMQYSFYITNERILRTHTSTVQARTMRALECSEPIRMSCTGKVYRRDSDDATHSHQFTQIE